MVRRIAVLGATSGIGRAIARRLAARGDRLCLLGRDPAQLARSAADLVARSGAGSRVTTRRCDLDDIGTFGAALEGAAADLDGLDAVVVTAGNFAPQRELERDPRLAHRLLMTGLASTVVFCEAARRVLQRGGGGTLCVVSSVAGDRGRSPVAIYGAAKAGLSAYLEALDHRWRRQGLVVVTVKPGFVRTSMTEGLQPPPFATTAEDVARDTVHAMDRAQPVAYSSWHWRWIMLAVRLLPRAVMRRVRF